MAKYLPKVPGYTTSFNKELNKVVFSSDLDGWCVSLSESEVKYLKSEGGLVALEKSILQIHVKAIETRSCSYAIIRH